ncbi:MAG: HAD-IA family hydrolase [Bacteroidetes bacterium]|nr:HAD-IA family hydrolase [Bacteroidota bacterium]
MNRRYHTIIFDFDYTLADSSRGVAECINFALKNLDLLEASYKDICRTIGLSLTDTFAELAGIENFVRSKEFTRLFTKRADEVMTAGTVMYKTVPPVIDKLKKRGIKPGIVSTKFRYRIQEILKRENMLENFDVIIGGEDVLRHKPDPEGLLKAWERMNNKSLQTLYIGDSIIDAETAQRAGLPFLAVLTGVTNREAFRSYKVEGFIGDLSCLEEWLSGN